MLAFVWAGCSLHTVYGAAVWAVAIKLSCKVYRVKVYNRFAQPSCALVVVGQRAATQEASRAESLFRGVLRAALHVQAFGPRKALAGT